TFNNVKVKNYTFERSFYMNEVIYIEYNNEKLETLVNGLFSDYGELFGRMIDLSLRNSQIRATVDVDTTAKFDDEKREGLQKYIDKLFATFSKSSIAIVPQMAGFKYNEVSSSNTSSKQSTEEITKLKNEYVTDVAKVIGVPPALIHGEMADQEANRETYVEFCIKPIIKKIEDELNAKLFSKNQFLDGNKIVAHGIDKPDIFKLANEIDKLTASGNFNSNEIRKAFGYEPREGGEVYRVTKNYQTEDEALKGGE
ncbi:MAG: phage portal protein, partial [Pisciglobus halotolerans]|nr:phage portal protein [Pisciglobus halotolerans]